MPKILQVGIHAGIVMPPGVTEPDLSHLTEETIAYYKKYFPCEDSTPEESERCWYTVREEEEEEEEGF